jgi:hypothetical protein
LLEKAMAPKAAMKSAMKTAMKAVIKTAMKVKGGSSSSKAPPRENKKLTKKALKDLGNYSLEDKVKKAIEDNEGNPEAAAEDFKKSLTKLEHSKIWGQHQTWLKNQPDSAITADDSNDSKKTKGLACALWYISNRGQKFINLSHKVGGSIAVKKVDEWLSEKQMMDRFGADFEAHCASGRIIWREDPVTRGTYEFKDQHQLSRETTTFKDKTLTRGGEDALDEDLDKMFEDLYQQDFLNIDFQSNDLFSKLIY